MPFRIQPNAVSPSQAVRCLFTGFRVATGVPTVRRQVFKSILINGIVFLVFLIGLIWGALGLTSGLVGADFWLLAGLGWLLRLALIIGILSIGPPIFSVLYGIIMPMFMSPVYQAGRKWANGPELEDTAGLKEEVRAVAIDIRRLGRLLLFSLLIFPFNLIPVVGNLAYVVAQIAIAAHTLGWDLLGKHFDLHGLNYSEQKSYLRDHRKMVLSVGFVAGVLCLIPLANIFFITTNVCGAGVLSAQIDGAGAKS